MNYYYLTVVTFNNYSDYCRAESILTGIAVNYLPCPCIDSKLYHIFLPCWFDKAKDDQAQLFFGRLDADEIIYQLTTRSLRLPLFR